MDGGSTWLLEASSWIDQLTDVLIINDTLSFAGGYRGLILRKKGQLFTALIVQNTYSDLAEIFPNPFKDYIFIQPKFHETIYFNLYDLSGRSAVEIQENGELKINTENIYPGFYIYEIRSNTRNYQTGKLIRH